jgi:MFS transporter, MHS family, proline/betaine transporter
MSVTAPFYTATVFVENFMQTLGYDRIQSVITSSLILITMMVVLPISAHLSDKIGRRPILISGLIAIIILIYPIFIVLGLMDYMLAIISQVVFAAIVAFYMGPVPTVLVELFETRVRFTGVALSYNLSAAIFGGSAPMVGMMLMKFTGDKYAIAYYLIILAIISRIILDSYEETYRKSLSEAEEFN